VVPLRRTYDYDTIGNRIESAEGGANLIEYSSNNVNQYTELVENSVTPGAMPIHDADGNMTANGTGWWYEWDGENRLIVARDYATIPSVNSIRVNSIYDSRSRRVKKVVEAWDGSQWDVTSEVWFTYDGWNMIYEEVEENGSLALEREYLWGRDLSGSLQGAGGVGGLLFVNRRVAPSSGWSGYEVHYDGNGNVTGLANAGTVEAHYEYDAFGNAVASDWNYEDWSPFQFSTKYLDQETGLYYYGYRFYDPVSGRWPNRDPIAEEGGINLYGFAVGDPIANYDYLGLVDNDCTFTIAIGHGLPPSGDTANSAVQKYLDSVYSQRGCGDRVGAVSCFSGNINDTYEHSITGPGDVRDDPFQPEFIPNPDNPEEQIWNPNEEGYLWSSEVLEALKQKIIDAEKLAEKDCKDPIDCKCDTITIILRPLSLQYFEGSNPLDLQQLLRTEEFEGVRNYTNTYDCEKESWSDPTIK